MSRNSLAVRAARQIQRLPQGWMRLLESPIVRARAKERPNIIFLLALPRSGSTVTYQTVIHGLQALYLSNLWNFLYGLPWTGGQLSRIRCANHESDFRSTQGFVEGACGPAEGLRFWSYWTGCGLNEVEPTQVANDRLSTRISYFTKAMSALTTPAAPMVAGYLGHALITEQLRTWFPEAVFIRLHRDPLSNAASILRCRKQGNSGWFSVLPAECSSIKGEGLHAEVAAQVYWLNRRLEWLHRDERTIDVTYEGLAADPNKALRELVDQVNNLGLRLFAKRELPTCFDFRVASPDDDEDTRLLFEELAELENKHGSLAASNKSPLNGLTD